MKIRIIFAAIALFAIASAFTSRKFVVNRYQFLLEETTRYKVDPTIRTMGTGSGQFTCEISLNKCTVDATNITAYQSGSSWYVDKQTGVTTTNNSTYTIH